ncbi:MAG: lecithin retinol acyltransferase family protein [Candidatus Hydrogenedentes bacterium]|nr:lecithin retinol acyltransferase family protein [Candidatus Hydrogenedentota bacterium]
MSICSDFCDMVDTIFDGLDELLEGTCLAGHDGGKNGNNHKAVPEPGDIIGVNRGIYQHYGIYAGDNQVIHYTADSSDIDPENAEIQETTLEYFLRDETEFFILDYNAPTAFSRWHMETDNEGEEKEEEEGPALFSREEILQRARTRLGEHKYNLLVNNCEHFVVWCKTGISQSRQVRQWVGLCHRILVGA